MILFNWMLFFFWRFSKPTNIHTWIEGLQAELEAAYKELNCVKNKLKTQDSELESLRSKHSEEEDDFNIKYSKQKFEIFF